MNSILGVIANVVYSLAVSMPNVVSAFGMYQPADPKKLTSNK